MTQPGHGLEAHRSLRAICRRGSFIALTATVLLSVGSEARDLSALFQGPAHLVEPEEPRYYPRPQYDLRAYAEYDSMSFFAEQSPDPLVDQSGDDDPYWIDGAAREVLQASMAHGGLEGTEDYPSASLYLLSPTTYRERRPSRNLSISYPPDGAAFPPNLCEIRVEWEDAVNDLWQITVGLADSGPSWSAITEEKGWWLPDDAWQALREESSGRRGWIQVKGVQRETAEATGEIQASPRVDFRISSWPADDAIVYRMVIPPFNKRKTPHTYSRDLRSFEVRPFLMSRNQYCFNCHTFSSKGGDRGRLSIQARYMMPGAALPVYLGIYDIDEQRGWKVKLPFDIQMSTFMSWSPDGRHLAFSANQQLVTFSPTVYETQYAGEPTSDLAIYDAVDNVSYLLPGARNPDRLEVLPRWSMDGSVLVYCSAPAGLHPAQTQYELYQIPFADGRGGEARPVPGGSGNGRSSFYPRFSPDGKWLSFCQADGGILIKPSSDIYLLPADLQGEARRLESNVDFAADSWHSWSSNGHWLVFASKRDDGVFARLYLTEIDDEGNAAPAIRLPLREIPPGSFNIPEFLAQAPHIDEADLFDAVRVERPARSANASAVEPQ